MRVERVTKCAHAASGAFRFGLFIEHLFWSSLYKRLRLQVRAEGIVDCSRAHSGGCNSDFLDLTREGGRVTHKSSMCSVATVQSHTRAMSMRKQNIGATRSSSKAGSCIHVSTHMAAESLTFAGPCVPVIRQANDCRVGKMPLSRQSIEHLSLQP